MHHVVRRSLTAGAVALVCACTSDNGSPPIGPDQVPSLEIRDGRNGGNAHFFFLAPIRPLSLRPPNTAPFNPELSPVIDVCELTAGTCTRQISHLTMNTGGLFDRVFVSRRFEEYTALWRTDNLNLNPHKTYRVSVLVGTRELGFADVDVVRTFREAKNVDREEFVPLLEDFILPIRFRIEEGALCARAGSDCGEGTVHPDRNNVIVTPNGQAGVFVPAGAVSSPVTITIESIDERPCFEGLLPPVFPGTPGAVGNSCYDYTTDPPLSEVNDGGRFNVPVIVGICIDVSDLPHDVQDLLQIFQFDQFEEQQIRALNNVAAPFLRCDPGFNPNFGARRSGVLDLAARGLRSLVQPVAALITPRALHASNRMMLDLGTGGETDFFSRFTWALPSDWSINFDQAPDESAVTAGTLVNTLYSRLGVTFSRTNPEGLCAGTGVYANDHGPGGFGSGQNNVTVCPQGIASDFSEAQFGAIQATFTLPAVRACVNATPVGEGAQAFIEAFSATGESLDRFESTTTPVAQFLCVSGTGISYVRFAGMDEGFAIFDNFFVTRTLPPIP